MHLGHLHATPSEKQSTNTLTLPIYSAPSQPPTGPAPPPHRPPRTQTGLSPSCKPSIPPNPPPPTPPSRPSTALSSHPLLPLPTPRTNSPRSASLFYPTISRHSALLPTLPPKPSTRLYHRAKSSSWPRTRRVSMPFRL